MPRIKSIIEIYEGTNMDARKPAPAPAPVEEEKKHEEATPMVAVEAKQEQPVYRSEAESNKNSFFHRVNRGHNQQVNVQVTVNEPQDDCTTSCFKGLSKCFGK